jgi:hypothetical protein
MLFFTYIHFSSIEKLLKTHFVNGCEVSIKSSIKSILIEELLLKANKHDN